MDKKTKTKTTITVRVKSGGSFFQRLYARLQEWSIKRTIRSVCKEGLHSTIFLHSCETTKEMKFKPVIDAIPAGGSPLYDVTPNSYIFEFRKGRLRLVKISKSVNRWRVTLSEPTLENISQITKSLELLENLMIWDGSCIMPVAQSGIGLICIDSRITILAKKFFAKNGFYASNVFQLL